MNAEAEKIIAQLALAPLPREGGFFRQTWVSQARLANGRAASSAIWFLLTPGNFSALHRLQAEELWHFYAGDPVEHVQLNPADGAVRVTLLAADFPGADGPQLTVPAGTWQGARLATGARPNAAHASTFAKASADKEDSPHPPPVRSARTPRLPARGWALLGCTLTPAWSEEEFELGSRAALRRKFPAAVAWIGALTR